ncbi:protein RoBo-1 [Phodopus roborovskii]|uniref:LOC691277 protein n=1 Tax=Phodopus roborovskii TaxID=109678 RepID=A0AAU9Z0W5_PHORO|nr:protein RoBo-1 [Phodopus roborovskii]CAH6786306.1 LOC691277 [Phodopus roborovskii]
MAWSYSLKNLLTVFGVTILAVGSVESYQCTVQECQNTSCPGNTNVCTASNGCFNQIQQFDTPFPDQVFKRKNCTGDTDTCSGLEFSATLGEQRRFRYVNRCCTSDQCNKDDLTLSQEPAEPNGIQCVAYYSELDSLHIPTSLKCTGTETKCIVAIGTAKGSSDPLSIVMAGMGCATESACNLKMTILNSIDITTYCLNGLPIFPPGSSVPDSTGLRPTSISTVPILVIFLLLKVLF